MACTSVGCRWLVSYGCSTQHMQPRRRHMQPRLTFVICCIKQRLMSGHANPIICRQIRSKCWTCPRPSVGEIAVQTWGWGDLCTPDGSFMSLIHQFILKLSLKSSAESFRITWSTESKLGTWPFGLWAVLCFLVQVYSDPWYQLVQLEEGGQS